MNDNQKKEFLKKIGNQENLDTLLQSNDGKLKLETLSQNILDC